MEKPMITIHNMETNEIIEREMNAEEFAQYKQTIAETELMIKQENDKKAAKELLLTKLGITAEEAALLLG
jgi:hypothetical protein